MVKSNRRISSTVISSLNRCLRFRIYKRDILIVCFVLTKSNKYTSIQYRKRLQSNCVMTYSIHLTQISLANFFCKKIQVKLCYFNQICHSRGSMYKPIRAPLEFEQTRKHSKPFLRKFLWFFFGIAHRVHPQRR